MSISIMAGGGVPGMVVGTVSRTIDRVGATIKAHHLFIDRYRQVGEMIIGRIVGTAVPGTINE